MPRLFIRTSLDLTNNSTLEIVGLEILWALLEVDPVVFDGDFYLSQRIAVRWAGEAVPGLRAVKRAMGVAYDRATILGEELIAIVIESHGHVLA